jgi:hypothetical protein
MDKKTKPRERVFTIELRSKRDLKSVALNKDADETAYVQGTVGELVEARFEEDVILEVRGTRGVLRVDLGEDEIKKRREAEEP